MSEYPGSPWFDGAEAYESHMWDQRLAQLEDLAIGLDQRGEKSSAHLIRTTISEINELRFRGKQ